MENKSINVLKVKVINLVLYPQINQKPEYYVDTFKEAYRNKTKIRTRGSHHTHIRTLIETEDCIWGYFSNAIFIDPDKPSVDINTHKIIDTEVDENTGYENKDWQFWFFPKNHRLVIRDDDSLSQIKTFLNEIFLQKWGEESYAINEEKDRNVISRILSATTITKLEIKLNYSNNANTNGWARSIDENLRASQSYRANFIFSGRKKTPIQISEDSMIRGAIDLSESNGHVEATIYREGAKSSETISTEDRPLVDSVTYEGDNIVSKLKHLVQKFN